LVERILTKENADKKHKNRDEWRNMINKWRELFVLLSFPAMFLT
jgi:hypothetical protein